MSYREIAIILLALLCPACENRLDEIARDPKYIDYNFHPLKNRRCRMGDYSIDHVKVSGSIGIGFYEGLETIKLYQHRYKDKYYVPIFLLKDYRSRLIFHANPTYGHKFNDIDVIVYEGRVECNDRDDERSGLVFLPHDIVKFFAR